MRQVFRALVVVLAATLALCGVGFAQTVSVLPNAMTQFVDGNGAPYAGGHVYMYIPGTTTPKATYQTPQGTSPNQNPITLDANGRAVIWGSGTYRQILQDAFGVVVWDQLTYASPIANANTIGALWYGTASGTANAITLSGINGFTGQDGQQVGFIASATNTASTEINASTYGPVLVEKNSLTGPVGLTGGEIIAGNLVYATYSAPLNAFIIQSNIVPLYNAGGAGSTSVTFQTKIASSTPLDLVADYGADPTGVTNATPAFTAMIADMCTLKRPGYVPSGTFTITAGVTTDFATCPFGFKLVGASHGQTVLDFVGTAGAGWRWIVSGGSGPTTTQPHVYDEMSNLTITCNLASICWALGQDNGADVFESSYFSNLYVSNTNGAAGAIAWRLNGANSNTFLNMQLGVSPATTTYAGNGIALQVVMAAFNTFINPSFGNANIGVDFADLNNKLVGFNYSNEFIDLDMENVCYGIELTNQANSATQLITFETGQMYTIGPPGTFCPMYSNQMAAPILPDGNVVFNHVNLGSNLPYEPLGAIDSFSAQSGSGTNGVYSGIALTGGHGTGAVGVVTVSSGVVSLVQVTSPGAGYYRGDVLGGTVPTVTGFGAVVGQTNNVMLDTTSTYWQGARIVGTYAAPITTLTPSGSAVGCNTNLFTNKTGQTQRETLTGAFTQYCINGQTLDFTSTGASDVQFQVDPGETFGIIYSGATPHLIQQTLTH